MSVRKGGPGDLGGPHAAASIRPAPLQDGGIHHVGVRAVDMTASAEFWCGTLRLVQHPEKNNWLGLPGSPHRFVHLMPLRKGERPRSGAEEDARDLARHVAFEVADLRVVVECLLRDGWSPFQADLEANRREITTADDPLTFGIGTVFVIDPAGNVVEFAQMRRGIFAEIQG